MRTPHPRRFTLPLLALMACSGAGTGKDSGPTTGATTTGTVTSGTGLPSGTATQPSTGTGTGTGAATGTGTGTGAPAFTVTPAALSFVPECADTLSMTVENTGIPSLGLSLAQLAGDPVFTVVAEPLPATLAPGDSWSAEVSYAPDGSPGPTGSLSISGYAPLGLVQVPVDTSATLGPVVEVFQATASAVDVLMMVDKSGSMTGVELAGIAIAPTDLIDELEALGLDWQISVVSRSTGCAEAVLDPTTPNVHDAFSTAMTSLQLTDITEALLESAEAALLESGPGGCAEGLTRAGVPLHVVVVSDEPNQSLIPVPDQLAALDSLLGGPGRLMVSAVVDTGYGCGAGAAGYLDAATSTGGAQLDVCADTWSSHFHDLAAVTSGYGQSRFSLAVVPDPATLTVSVDGVPTLAFSWDGAANAVVLDTLASVGATIEVGFTGVACRP